MMRAARKAPFALRAVPPRGSERLRSGRAALLIAAVVLSGCALKSPPTHTYVVEQALPTTTRIPPAWRADPSGGEVANDWLKSFNDPMLDAIVAAPAFTLPVAE